MTRGSIPGLSSSRMRAPHQSPTTNAPAPAVKVTPRSVPRKVVARAAAAPTASPSQRRTASPSAPVGAVTARSSVRMSPPAPVSGGAETR